MKSEKDNIETMETDKIEHEIVSEDSNVSIDTTCDDRGNVTYAIGVVGKTGRKGTTGVDTKSQGSMGVTGKKSCVGVDTKSQGSMGVTGPQSAVGVDTKSQGSMGVTGPQSAVGVPNHPRP